MNDALTSAATSLGAATPFALLAIYVIRWLMKEVEARNATISAQYVQLLQLAQSQMRTSQEQTEAIKSLGH